MHRTFLKIGAAMGGISVLLGAFGAHQLKEYLNPEVMATFQTGVTYQFFHSIALCLVAFWGDESALGMAERRRATR